MYRSLEQWIEIRRRVLIGEISKRHACREYELHWQTLQKIPSEPVPPEQRKCGPPRSPKLDPFRPIIEAILDDDRKAPRKQRHTGWRIFKLYEQRMTWKAQVAMQASLEKERDRLHREIAAADKALADAETHHSEVTGPLHGELAQTKDGMNDASTARSRLFDTCDDEYLWQQLRELNREGLGTQPVILRNSRNPANALPKPDSANVAELFQETPALMR